MLRATYADPRIGVFTQYPIYANLLPKSKPTAPAENWLLAVKHRREMVNIGVMCGYTFQTNQCET